MSSPVTPTTPFVDLRPDRTRTYESPRPILDRILVRKLAQASAPDGFEIPDKYREPSRRGEVMAVGDCVVLGRELQELTSFVNVGDIVTFGEHSAEQDYTDPSLYIIRVHDIRYIERLIRE